MTPLDHRFTHEFDAPPERLWRALTQSEELTAWFAEHAEVELAVGGAFRFWGRDVYGTSSRDRADQTLTAFEPESKLAFTWRVEERPSEVTLELAPADPAKRPGGTSLAIRHHFAEAPAIARAPELVEDLWRLHCGNLGAHLEGGAGILRPDYADRSPEIRLSIHVAAPRARVFRALLDPEILNRWIAGAAEVEERPGGRYSYGWKYSIAGREVVGGPSRILELVENEKLVTDWPDWRGDSEVPVQTITWSLEDEGEGTRVRVVHSGFVRAVDWSDYPFGWGGFLEALKGAVEAASS